MWIILICFGILSFFSFYKAVKGPSVPDRLITINLIGSIVIMMLAILAVILKEDYLLDICIIYAMISFLAMVVLSKIYTGIYLSKKAKEQEKNEKEEKN
ncbi:MAG: sodium:proton antiporter [Lachnospiraceae bacterium]|nr:sodium:proton antiporter [Lachnospiraceae bacterium]